MDHIHRLLYPIANGCLSDVGTDTASMTSFEPSPLSTSFTRSERMSLADSPTRSIRGPVGSPTPREEDGDTFFEYVAPSYSRASQLPSWGRESPAPEVGNAGEAAGR